MGDKKVKGTMLIDYVRTIRATKDKDWDKYLEPEDWELIDGRILAGMWYSFETFQRIGMAVFHIIAGGNMDIVRAFGKISFGKLMEEVYKNVISTQDPLMGIKRFLNMRSQFFDFGVFKLEQSEEKKALVSLTFAENEPGVEPFCYQLAGGFERLIELTGGKNPRASIIEKGWEGAPATKYDISWD